MNWEAIMDAWGGPLPGLIECGLIAFDLLPNDCIWSFYWQDMGL